jgi:hypothetical protein
MKWDVDGVILSVLTLNGKVTARINLVYFKFHLKFHVLTCVFTIYRQGFKFPEYANFTANQMCSSSVIQAAHNLLFCVTQLAATCINKYIYIYIYIYIYD